MSLAKMTPGEKHQEKKILSKELSEILGPAFQHAEVMWSSFQPSGGHAEGLDTLLTIQQKATTAMRSTKPITADLHWARPRVGSVGVGRQGGVGLGEDTLHPPQMAGAGGHRCSGPQCGGGRRKVEAAVLHWQKKTPFEAHVHGLGGGGLNGEGVLLFTQGVPPRW